MAKKTKQTQGQEKKSWLTSFHFFQNNTLVLAFSFLCAIIVWFVMMDSKVGGRDTIVSNIPIEIELSEAAQEAGVRIFEQSHASTDVSVLGNTLITSKLTSADIGVTASLDPSLSMLTGNSMQEATVTLRAYKKGNTVSDYEIESVSPSEVTVVYDKYKEMTLTLDNKVQYSAADEYYASTSTLSTEYVTISGPESQVNKVANAALIYSFSEELTQSKSISCKVSLFDVDGELIDPSAHYLSLSAPTVDVSVMVTSRQIVSLLPDIRNMPENFAEHRISLEPKTIEIAGDGEIVSKYKELTLSTPINFRNVTPDNYTFELEIPVPSGVTNISNTQTAKVTFNLNGYTETNLKTENINVINVPSGKQVELVTKNINVTVVGTAAQVSKLTGESIFCTIDFSEITELKKSMEVPVSVVINNADSCWVTDTYTAYVVISDAEPSSNAAE